MLTLATLTLTGSCRLEPTFGRTPYVHNLTRFGLTVQLRMLEGIPNCALLLEHIDEITEDAYGRARHFELAPGEVLPVLEPMRDNTSECGAAHIRIGDDFQRVVFWNTSSLVGVLQSVGRDDPEAEQALQVEGVPGRHFVRVGALLTAAPLPERAPPEACDAPVAPPIAWSGLIPGSMRLRDVRPGVDGCLTLEHDDGISFMCVPERMFPFVAGDRVEVSIPAAISAGSDLRVVRAAEGIRLSRGNTDLLVYRDAPLWPLSLAFTGTLGDRGLEDAQCAARRDGCGSYFVPARAPLMRIDREAGSEILSTSASGRDIYLGRVERVVVDAPGCAAAGPDGTRVDVAVLQREAPTRDAGIDDDGGTDDTDAGGDAPPDDDAGVETGEETP